jgi:hypothetical protein
MQGKLKQWQKKSLLCFLSLIFKITFIIEVKHTEESKKEQGDA